MSFCTDMQEVYPLAADMDGMGFISSPHAQNLYYNALINLHTLEAAHGNGMQPHSYTSSPYLYPEFLQTDTTVRPLKEENADPAQPQDAYGWERMLTEPLCLHYQEDYGMAVHILRFHNICGLQGTW